MKHIMRNFVIIAFAALSFYILTGCVTSTAAPEGIEQDIALIQKGYDNIRTGLIEIYTKSVGIPPEDAAAAVDALAAVFGALGGASQNAASMPEVFDKWAAMWDTPEFEQKLMGALKPLGMDDPDKTRNLMKFAREASTLPPNATEEQARPIFEKYLSPETVSIALEMGRKARAAACKPEDYSTFDIVKGLRLNLSPKPECVTREDFQSLFESHYGKKLPGLAAFVDGLKAWLEDTKNMQKLLEIYVSGGAVQRVIAAVNDGSLSRDELDALLKARDLPIDIFRLMLNLAPYGKNNKT